MKDNNRAHFKNSVIAFLAIFGTLGWCQHFHYKSTKELADKKTEKQINSVVAGTIENAIQISEVKEAIQENKKNDVDTIIKKRLKDSTVKLIANIDSVNHLLSLTLQFQKTEKNLISSRDSNVALKQQILVLTTEKKSLTDKQKNLTVIVENLDSKLTDQYGKEVGYDIKIEPQPPRKMGLIRAPKDYFRVYATDTTRRVNGNSYYEYGVPNAEIYQVNFQGRASYNLATGNYATGAGIEFKVNRLGINAAWLGNPENLGSYLKRSSFSAGLRYDFARIKLP